MDNGVDFPKTVEAATTLVLAADRDQARSLRSLRSLRRAGGREPWERGWTATAFSPTDLLSFRKRPLRVLKIQNNT